MNDKKEIQNKIDLYQGEIDELNKTANEWKKIGMKDSTGQLLDKIAPIQKEVDNLKFQLG